MPKSCLSSSSCTVLDHTNNALGAPSSERKNDHKPLGPPQAYSGLLSAPKSGLSEPAMWGVASRQCNAYDATPRLLPGHSIGLRRRAAALAPPPTFTSPPSLSTTCSSPALAADLSTSTTMLVLPARILVVPTIRPAALGPLSRRVSSPPCLRGFYYAPATGADTRFASLRLPSRRCFASSLPSHSPEPSSSSPAPILENKPTESSPAQTKSNPPSKSIWSRFLPSNAQESGKSASSFRKIAALALPEKKPLGIAIGLLLVSSSVSMSVPFTIGKLIDYFSTVNPVRSIPIFTRFAVQVLLYPHPHARRVGNSVGPIDRASVSAPPPLVHGGCDCECGTDDAYETGWYVFTAHSILRPGPWPGNATHTGVLQVSGSSHGYGNGHTRQHCSRRSSSSRRVRVMF